MIQAQTQGRLSTLLSNVLCQLICKISQKCQPKTPIFQKCVSFRVSLSMIEKFTLVHENLTWGASGSRAPNFRNQIHNLFFLKKEHGDENNSSINARGQRGFCSLAVSRNFGILQNLRKYGLKKVMPQMNGNSYGYIKARLCLPLKVLVVDSHACSVSACSVIFLY